MKRQILLVVSRGHFKTGALIVVILSAAKNLGFRGGEILRFAQDDRFEMPPSTLITMVLMAGLIGCQTDEGERPMAIQVMSTAFSEEERIPTKYTYDGEDVSPPLAWSDLPEETRELALICDDPDAQTEEPWVHWVIYKIPADATGLPEAVARQARLRDGGMLQGQNSWSGPSKPSIGYRGPMPPPGHGDHHYRFTLYALSGKLVVGPGITKRQLLAEMEDHVLGTGRLVGVYSR